MRGLLLLLLAFGAQAQPMPAIPGDAGWTLTAQGCYVWNPLGAANESASWTGPCVDRHANGEGVLVWRQNGHATGIYKGRMQFGRLNGPGEFLFANGDRFRGTFTDDLLNGPGELTKANGNHYVGEFRAFRMHGHGTFTFANGDRYEGAFANNLPHGEGRLTWASGEHYEGHVSAGIPDGQGSYTAANQTYTGLWRHGCFTDPKRPRAVGVPAESCAPKPAP